LFAERIKLSVLIFFLYNYYLFYLCSFDIITFVNY
jgi:hypothetical protein